MIDTDGAVPVAAPDAPSEAPVEPASAVQIQEPPDWSRPRLFKPVLIELDRPRRMRLSFKALRLFQTETGISPWDHDKIWGMTYADTDSLNVLTTLLWCALLDDDPTLTREQLEELPGMEIGSIHHILNRLQACWGEQMPPADDARATNGAAPKASRQRG